VQKPFTADELADFTQKCLIRRQDRLEQQTPPKVQVVNAPGVESKSPHVINVPGGLYVSSEHTWVGVGVTGEVQVGLDDLALKTLGPLDEIEFPGRSSFVSKGDPLFVAVRGDQRLTFPSPISGKITKVHHDLTYQLEVLPSRPAHFGWICALEPDTLSAELAELRIGADAIDWYERQILELWRRLEAPEAGAEREDQGWQASWQAFERAFLPPTHEPATA
jgi:glycine cleavage system H lipoate-binding protein